MIEHEASRELDVSAGRAFAALSQINAYRDRFDPCVMSSVTACGPEVRRDGSGGRNVCVDGWNGADGWSGLARLRFELPRFRVREDVSVAFTARPGSAQRAWEIDMELHAASTAPHGMWLDYRIEPTGPARCMLHVAVRYETLPFRLFPLSLAAVRERMVGLLAGMVEEVGARFAVEPVPRPPAVLDGPSIRAVGRP